MIRKLLDQVVSAVAGPADAADGGTDREKAIRLATAVLMADVARADHDYEESEFATLLDLVQRHFALTPEEAAELVNTANEKAEDLVSIHEFTQVLHRHLDERDKARIVSLLWQVAYADGRLDKFEDTLVLRIADLLYVNRATVMRLKQDAGPGNGD